ncbi:hypothetical protein [Bosea rubneri]|uniref:DUF2336 domain-containing protein n=1 Tax=Bosea rubneri TaxID=3075434 RepID=A0ABU3S9Q8_9HYPH|nr:hypothetical protein [Bosea sp. ZW T0_25]MDU0341100.1 hypothetical protein [Bosea sp. ZW T0_25]
MDDEAAIADAKLTAMDAVLQEHGFRKTIAYVETEDARASKRALREAARKTELAEKGIRQLNLMTSQDVGWRNALGVIAKLYSAPDMIEAVKTLAGDPDAARRLQRDTQTKPEGQNEHARAPAPLHLHHNLTEDEAIRLRALLARPEAVSLLALAETLSDERLKLLVEAMRSEALPVLLRETISHDLGELVSRLAGLLQIENRAEARLNGRLVLAFLTYPNWRSVFAHLGRNADARANLALLLHDETVATLLAGYRTDRVTASALRHLVSPAGDAAKSETRRAAVALVDVLLSDPTVAARLQQGEPANKLLENLKRAAAPRETVEHSTISADAASGSLLHRIGAVMRAASMAWSASAGSRISITRSSSQSPRSQRRQSSSRVSR